MRTKVRTPKRNINIINLVSTVILLYILGSFSRSIYIIGLMPIRWKIRITCLAY